MKFSEIFKTIIDLGIKQDPRGRDIVLKDLAKKKKKYEALSKKEKECFDKEKLTNPYSDSRILYGNIESVVKSVLVGVDLETQELVMLDALRNKGKSIDLAIAHHPEGRSLASFYEVMDMQADIMNSFGVPINIAEDVMRARIKEVSHSILPVNYNRAVDCARLLDINFMSAHTPADNHVATYLQKKIDKENPETLNDLLDILTDIEEYKLSKKDNNGPKILLGSKSDRCGKIYVDMTGGTESSAEAMEKLAKAGVGTIVGMHMSKALKKQAQASHMRVIIAGHMASDTLGLNLLLDGLQKKAKNLNIISCSGFIRISR